jgi:hypothetical protein
MYIDVLIACYCCHASPTTAITAVRGVNEYDFKSVMRLAPGNLSEQQVSQAKHLLILSYLHCCSTMVMLYVPKLPTHCTDAAYIHAMWKLYVAKAAATNNTCTC